MAEKFQNLTEVTMGQSHTTVGILEACMYMYMYIYIGDFIGCYRILYILVGDLSSKNNGVRWYWYYLGITLRRLSGKRGDIL